jgi:hypothetical protein
MRFVRPCEKDAVSCLVVHGENGYNKFSSYAIEYFNDNYEY